MITRELFDACEFAKTAADMSIPVEPMPTPEPGSEAIEGMVNGSMMDPNSVGAGTYAGAVDQAALAQAKARAAAAAQAAAAQKTAAVEEAFEMGYFDAYNDYAEYNEYDAFNKFASVEDAYEYGYMAAMEELEKLAADAYAIIDGTPVKLPDYAGPSTVREVGEHINKYIPVRTPKTRAKQKPGDRVAAAYRKSDAAKLKAYADNVSTADKLKARAIAAKNNARGELLVQKALVSGSAKNTANTVTNAVKSAPGAAKAYAKANPKYLAGSALGLAGLAGAGVLGKRAIDAQRRAKLLRRAGIGGAALAGLAGLGYAAHKARD